MKDCDVKDLLFLFYLALIQLLREGWLIGLAQSFCGCIAIKITLQHSGRKQGPHVLLYINEETRPPPSSLPVLVLRGDKSDPASR